MQEQNVPFAEVHEATDDAELLERAAFMADVGTEAGDMMRAGFHANRDEVDSHHKTDGSIVTDVDEKIQNHTNARCAARGDVTVGEESSTGTHGQNAWHVDPLDGTRNFDERRGGARETSIAAFSAGWVTVENGRHTPRVGVIELPLLRQPASFQAVEGRGAMSIQGGQMRELRIDQEPNTGLVLVSSSPKARPYIAALEAAGFTTVRADGAVFKGCLFADPALAAEHAETHQDTLSVAEIVALEAAAAGELPIVASVSAKTYAHDHAATSRIVMEAGGLVSGVDGGPLSFESGPQGSIFANNFAVQQQIAEILQGLDRQGLL